MANTKKAQEQTTTTSATVDNIDTVAEISKDVVVEKVEKKKEVKTNKKVNKEPLQDDDDIEVQSMIPNVSYFDAKNQDYYEWKQVGDIEIMTFEALKNMWKNSRGYFKKLWLRPLDERVVAKFNGLSKLYEDFDELMDINSYTRDNVSSIAQRILDMPRGTSNSVITLIIDSVDSGKLNDIKVLKELEKTLGLDLISLI